MRQVCKAQSLLEKMSKEFIADRSQAKPERPLFRTVIAAWMNSNINTDQACDGCNALLSTMWRLYDSGAQDLRPDLSLYNMVLACCKNSGNAFQASSILAQMRRLNNEGRLLDAPDEQTYRIVIDAWRESKEADKTIRIAQLTREVKLLFSSGGNGNSNSYNNSNGGLSNSSSKHNTRVLNHQKSRYFNSRA
jgi:hypothetical protein